MKRSNGAGLLLIAGAVTCLCFAGCKKGDATASAEADKEQLKLQEQTMKMEEQGGAQPAGGQPAAPAPSPSSPP